MRIEVGDNLIIQCPEINFAFRKAKTCFTCDHYNGLSGATVNGEVMEGETAEDFLIMCGRPISRHMQIVEIES